MRNNNLIPNKGLSLSQAQSISNLCNQRAKEITAQLSNVNNYSKSVKAEGKDHTTVTGKQLPKNTVELLKEKARLHGCQAFLMENIKAKDMMLKLMKNAVAVTDEIEFPDRPKQVHPILQEFIEEEWGWEQLTANELNEFMEAEAFAAHIGQFIHKGSDLDRLRNELPHVPPVEWMVVTEGTKSPVTVTVHHTPEELLKVHEKLATEHRKFEQRVNYFKAKVKNLVTAKNTEIAKHNNDAQNETSAENTQINIKFETAYNIANEKVKDLRAKFEVARQEEIKEIVSTRIDVDGRFQSVVDDFLNQLDTEEK